MRYYKDIEQSYIMGIGTGSGQVEISREEYDELMSIIRSRPADPEGYVYMLRADNLEWELVELPPEPVDDPDAQPEDYEQVLADLGVRLS